MIAIVFVLMAVFLPKIAKTKAHASSIALTTTPNCAEGWSARAAT